MFASDIKEGGLRGQWLLTHHETYETKEILIWEVRMGSGMQFQYASHMKRNVFGEKSNKIDCTDLVRMPYKLNDNRGNPKIAVTY